MMKKSPRFLILFISLLLMLILRPFVETLTPISFLVDIFFLIISASLIYAVSETRKQFYITSLLTGLAILNATIYYCEHGLTFVLLGDISNIALIGYASTLILSHIFKQEQITTDTIFGALSVYFLFGLLWALIYHFLTLISPDTFQFSLDMGTQRHPYIYFSYVTLTTLGYGDITPLTKQAQSLAVVEAATGQVYLAFLVAKLVGVHIAQITKSQSQDR